jgi:hypothetical protein
MPTQEYNGYLIDNQAIPLESGRFNWRALVRINESFVADEYWHPIAEGEADTEFHARKEALAAARRAVEDKILSRRSFRIEDAVLSVDLALAYAGAHGAKALLTILDTLEHGYWPGVGLQGFVWLRRQMASKP